MKISVTKDLTPLRTAADAEITRRAGKMRASYATPGKDGIYLAKREEAERWFADGEPADLTAYPFLTEEVTVTAPNAYQLATLWINLNTLWLNVVGPQIEGLEQRAKLAASIADTPAKIDLATAMLPA